MRQPVRWDAGVILTETTRPRVSRETRRLLVAAGLALLALWILARLRFPERPPSPNPVAPVLTQISPPTTFTGLAQGASLTLNGMTFQISYAGGTGNDVVLTRTQ